MRFVYPSVFDPQGSIEVWFCDDLCCNGKELHRGGGDPAVIYPDGSREWWLHGKQVTEAEALARNGELVAEAMRNARARPTVGPTQASFLKLAEKRAIAPKGEDRSEE
jgi:hypothetical protein